MKNTLLVILSFFGYILCVHSQNLYNTTFNGGNDGGGTINKFTLATNNLMVAKSFESFDAHPDFANFIQANDGKLYGMTSRGGSHGNGVIFSYDLSSSTYKKVEDFDGINGARPLGTLMQAIDGKLYGMTNGGGINDAGVIFSIDPLSHTYTKLIDFNDMNGASPFGSLIQASDGKLYGITLQGGANNLGVIFSYDPLTYTYKKLKDFDYSVSGYYPANSLIQAVDGKLYGMTRSGGVYDLGVIFSFDPLSSVYTKLWNFDGASGAHPFGSLLQVSDGRLYGMTRSGGVYKFGVVFSFDPADSIFTKLKEFDKTNGDGSNPAGSLVQANDGKLYGLTPGGGSSSVGTIFSFDPSANIYIKLKDLDYSDGVNPAGSLLKANDGKLYGVTPDGGKAGYYSGVIFSFDPATSVYKKLKDFGTNGNGSNVSASLVQAIDRKLYGVTKWGGTNGYGVIFSFDPVFSTFAKRKDFDNVDGANPIGSLVQASDGKLYGMASAGGNSNTASGVIFSFDPLSSVYIKLKDFDLKNGGIPVGSLIEASDGKLYGMTISGGSNSSGIIFSYDPSTSIYAVLKEFDYTDGAYPYGSLVQAVNGKLYGMTANGGSKDYGVIFSFDPLSFVYTKLIEFDGINGRTPYGSLIRTKNEKLYGMTSEGGNNNNDAGVIFSFDPLSSTYTKLKDFDGANGSHPAGSLMQASDGKLYGVTVNGGSNDYGVIFSFDPSTSLYTKLKDFDITNSSVSNGSTFIEVKDMSETGSANNLQIKVMPNPAGYQFNLTVESGDRINPITMKVINAGGQLIEIRSKLVSGQTIKVGNNYPAGSYLIQAVQGNQRRTIKVIKVPE